MGVGWPSGRLSRSFSSKNQISRRTTTANFLL
jgi:hypothetical protein